MKRSEINGTIRAARLHFEAHGWVLPPNPKWDVTDFGLGSFIQWGLVLVNLAEEQEYCEKLMYALAGQKTPAHYHRFKKEDIICRNGTLAIQVWAAGKLPGGKGATFPAKVNGEIRQVNSGGTLTLQAGERITISPGVWHEFQPLSPAAIIGEVSTANDDMNDNFFADPDIGRYPDIDEDEPAMVKLLSDRS